MRTGFSGASGGGGEPTEGFSLPPAVQAALRLVVWSSVHDYNFLDPSLQSSFHFGHSGVQRGCGRLRLQQRVEGADRRGFSGCGVGSGVCTEPSVLGTFVLDSPSKVLFHPVRVGFRADMAGCGFSGTDRLGGSSSPQRASSPGLSGAVSVLGTFVLDSPSKVLFSSFWGALTSADGVQRSVRWRRRANGRLQLAPSGSGGSAAGRLVVCA